MNDTELMTSESVFESGEELETLESLDEIEVDEPEAPTAELVTTEALKGAMDATQLYLGEIGFSPLLTAEEEVFLPGRRCVEIAPRANR